MTQHFANQKRKEIGNDPVQAEKKKRTSKVLSTIALIFAVLALVCGILSPLMIANPAGSIHLTGQAVLEIGGFVVLSLFGFTFSLIGFVFGIIGGISVLANKRKDILWMPGAAVAVSVIACIITYLGLPG